MTTIRSRMLYRTAEADQGMRLSQFLANRRFPGQSIAELKWTEGSILVDGVPSKMNQRLLAGQEVTVRILEKKASDQIREKELPFPVVYEDEDLIVVNKPSGMPSQPSWYYEDSSLASAAAFYWKRQGMQPFVYRCVNRLDKDTSGLLILAKHALAGAILNQMHGTGELVRLYYAVAEAETDRQPLAALLNEGVIALPIGKDESAANRYQVDFENGKPAKTHYRVLDEWNGRKLLELRLETGRTHQIRVHMSALGYPLVGDCIYRTKTDGRERLALHAGKLEFPHPMTGMQMTFDTEIPASITERLG